MKLASPSYRVNKLKTLSFEKTSWATMSMSPVYLPCSNKCMPCGKGRVVHYTKGNKAHAVGHLVQRLKDGR